MKKKTKQKDMEKRLNEIKETIEEDIYTEKGVEHYFEDDEISLIEEGFMRGYLAS